MDVERGKCFFKEELIDLYSNVEWKAYLTNADRFWDSIMNSLEHFVIRNDGIIVAYARILGDSITAIMIQDIIVRTEYQNKGIGTELLRHILKYYENVRQVVLLCDDVEPLNKYYMKNGLRKIGEYKCNCFARMACSSE